MRSRIGPPELFASDGPGGAVVRRLLPTTVAAVALLGLLGLQGEYLGLYGTTTGVALLTGSVIVGLTGLLWRFATWLDRNDAERRTAEREARRSGRYFELARDLVCTASLEGRFMDLNAAWTETLGWSEDELRSTPFVEFVHPDDRKQTEHETAKLGGGGISVEFVNRYRAKDGSWRWLDWSATGIPEEDLIYASARDITDRKEAEDTARRLAAAGEFASKERQVILDSIGEGIMSVDAEGRTTFSNRAAHELTGWSDEDLLGTVQHDLLHHSHAEGTPYPREDCPIYEVLKTGDTTRRDDEVFWRKDGSSFPVEYVSAPLHREGEIVGAVLAFQDITERKRSRDELALARDEALEASRMKSQFLANMSHEIRTPLNGVIGMTELLLDTSLDSEQHEYARTVQSSGESLLEVINDILDFSKIEAGRLELEEAQFDLPDAVDDVCDLVANRAHAKGLELASDIREGVPRLVLGDQTRLRQVLTNLLSNAIKFTSEGEVISIVSSTAREGDHAAVRFEVQDTGIGIDPGNLDRLFESFSQADASTTRRFGGTGLGLAISKQLVELMGGEIGAQNRPEGGSAFWFRIPFATVAESREEERPAPDVGGLRLLVVDDNATNRTIVTRLATSWGMASDAAESGHEALEMLRTAAEAGEPYEVAVLDLMMPGMDGIELARRITEDPRLRAVRMVMLASGLASRRDAEAVGIAVYLTKPARRSLLYNAVVTAAAAPEPGEEASAQPAPAPLRAAILVVEDNPANQAVAEGMLTRRGHPVDIARNGREALEALACGTYGAVLMDCQMPEMDGYEATGEIRRREANGRRIPIIAMTAHSMKGDRERCLAAGMDDHLPKPMRGEALDATLARWVAPPNGDTLAKRGASPQANGNGPIDLETLERLRAEFGGLGRADALDSVLRQFLETTPGRVAAIIDAVDRGSDEDVNQEAHALRGASSSFGATQLAGVCSALERSGCDGDLEQARALIPNLEEAATSTRAALHQWIAAPGSPQPVDAGR